MTSNSFASTPLSPKAHSLCGQPKPKPVRTATAIVTICLIVASPVAAEDYYNAKWFDYPDGATRTVDGGCGQWISVFGADQCIAPNAPTVEMERRDVVVKVSGPNSPDEAVRQALIGYAVGCVATAVAGSTAGPQVVAAPAGFFGIFQGCITALSVGGVAGGIIDQLQISVDDSSTHWSPL